MQSICWTTRYLSRALRHGFSTLIEPNTKAKPHFITVACGFPKDFLRSKYKLGKFGEDAWFTAKTNDADVIGNYGKNILILIIIIGIFNNITSQRLYQTLF